ncbi:MAG: DUF1524 domain-containing protein [Chloroflexi bacterium]|nr:DUF1524 domain-containing protein [Chloroflexota bacterium]
MCPSATPRWSTASPASYLPPRAPKPWVGPISATSPADERTKPAPSTPVARLRSRCAKWGDMMKLFKRRRRSRKSPGGSMLIFWIIAAAIVLSIFTPTDSSPSATRIGTEHRPRATVAKPIIRATKTPKTVARATAESAAPACYRHEQVWLTGRMNIRQRPSTSARILGNTAYGERYAVAGSRQGDAYCWLDIEPGWVAVTNLVSASKPPAPTATSRSVAPQPASNNAVQQALAALQRLTVAPENRCSPYDSGDYDYPQSVESQIVGQMGGRIYGPYTGRTFANTRETDIEHIVARSEAHDSGLCAANVQTREAFSRDLLNLTLAAPELNRHQKIAKDFAEWVPPRNKCWYADRIIKVKSKYRLSVDSREKAALENALLACSSVAMAM